MPPDRQLSSWEIALLENWVRLGAPDPRETEKPAAAVATDASDPVAGKQHWAYRPLQPPVQPLVLATDWPRSTLDRFVLARLKDAGLHPAPDADRRTLVRRLYFQLHGLPPTPEQVRAFLNDNRTDAWERLVDKLLESPQFGERWGRHQSQRTLSLKPANAEGRFLKT